jgi:hypothetical protein
MSLAKPRPRFGTLGFEFMGKLERVNNHALIIRNRILGKAIFKKLSFLIH